MDNSLHSDGKVLYLGGESVRSCVDEAWVDFICVASVKLKAKFDDLESAPRVLFTKDHTDVEAVLGTLAAAGISLDDFHTVCSGDEFAVVTASVLSRGCGKGNLFLPEAVAMRDKQVQKSPTL